MADDKNDLTANHPNRKTRGESQQQPFVPGETNARASRTASPRRNPDGTLIDDGSTGQQAQQQAGAGAGTMRVRMTRDEGERRTGELVTVAADEGRRLIDAGAAAEAGPND